MDIERTIEFILKVHADVSADMEASKERHARAEKRLDDMEARTNALIQLAASHQNQIEALTVLVRTIADEGKRRSEEMDRRSAEADRRIDSLARMFEDWLRRGGNGSRQ